MKINENCFNEQNLKPYLEIIEDYYSRDYKDFDDAFVNKMIKVAEDLASIFIMSFSEAPIPKNFFRYKKLEQNDIASFSGSEMNVYIDKKKASAYISYGCFMDYVFVLIHEGTHMFQYLKAQQTDFFEWDLQVHTSVADPSKKIFDKAVTEEVIPFINKKIDEKFASPEMIKFLKVLLSDKESFMIFQNFLKTFRNIKTQKDELTTPSFIAYRNMALEREANEVASKVVQKLGEILFFLIKDKYVRINLSNDLINEGSLKKELVDWERYVKNESFDFTTPLENLNHKQFSELIQILVEKGYQKVVMNLVANYIIKKEQEEVNALFEVFQKDNNSIGMLSILIIYDDVDMIKKVQIDAIKDKNYDILCDYPMLSMVAELCDENQTAEVLDILVQNVDLDAIVGLFESKIEFEEYSNLKFISNQKEDVAVKILTTLIAELEKIVRDKNFDAYEKLKLKFSDESEKEILSWLKNKVVKKEAKTTLAALKEKIKELFQKEKI